MTIDYYPGCEILTYDYHCIVNEVFQVLFWSIDDICFFFWKKNHYFQVCWRKKLPLVFSLNLLVKVLWYMYLRSANWMNQRHLHIQGTFLGEAYLHHHNVMHRWSDVIYSNFVFLVIVGERASSQRSIPMKSLFNHFIRSSTSFKVKYYRP